MPQDVKIDKWKDAMFLEPSGDATTVSLDQVERAVFAKYAYTLTEEGMVRLRDETESALPAGANRHVDRRERL